VSAIQSPFAGGADKIRQGFVRRQLSASLSGSSLTFQLSTPGFAFGNAALFAFGHKEALFPQRA
jgi:hypothetical protein